MTDQHSHLHRLVEAREDDMNQDHMTHFQKLSGIVPTLPSLEEMNLGGLGVPPKMLAKLGDPVKVEKAGVMKIYVYHAPKAKVGGKYVAVVQSRDGRELPGSSGTTPEEALSKTKALLKKAGAKIESAEDLSEELSLSKGDKKVIAAFLDKRAASSKKLTTDGQTLDIMGMGGRGCCQWKAGKIAFKDLGSRSGQVVQRAVRKAAPKNWLAEADKLGKPDVITGMKFGTRYKYNHGIFIDHVEDKGEFHVSQAGRPSKKLGFAKSLAKAKEIALRKGDFMESADDLDEEFPPRQGFGTKMHKIDQYVQSLIQKGKSPGAAARAAAKKFGLSRVNLDRHNRVLTYESADDLDEASDRFELVYGTGGTGGPYQGLDKAKAAAERLLKGNRNEPWIAVIPAAQTTDLAAAKPVEYLHRKHGWTKGGGMAMKQIFRGYFEGAEEDGENLDERVKMSMKVGGLEFKRSVSGWEAMIGGVHYSARQKGSTWSLYKWPSGMNRTPVATGPSLGKALQAAKLAEDVEPDESVEEALSTPKTREHGIDYKLYDMIRKNPGIVNGDLIKMAVKKISVPGFDKEDVLDFVDRYSKVGFITAKGYGWKVTDKGERLRKGATEDVDDLDEGQPYDPEEDPRRATDLQLYKLLALVQDVGGERKLGKGAFKKVAAVKREMAKRGLPEKMPPKSAFHRGHIMDKRLLDPNAPGGGIHYRGEDVDDLAEGMPRKAEMLQVGNDHYKVVRVYPTKEHADGPFPRDLLRLIKPGGGALLLDLQPGKNETRSAKHKDVIFSSEPMGGSSRPRYYMLALKPGGQPDGSPVSLKPAQYKRVMSYQEGTEAPKAIADGDALITEDILRYRVLAGMDPLPRRPMTEALQKATVRAFLAVLTSKITQYDKRVSAKERMPNIYRLGHLLGASQRVEERVKGVLDQDTPEALKALVSAMGREFTPDFSPVKAVKKQIEAYLSTGKMPTLR